MVPPLALALATAVRPRLFSPAEQENSKAAWLLGASFISEGAIPFAAADPLRVIPPVMLGARPRSARHGGSGRPVRAARRDLRLLRRGRVAGFLLALAVGTAVGAAAVLGAKSLGRSGSGSAAAVPAPALA